MTQKGRWEDKSKQNNMSVSHFESGDSGRQGS